KGVPLLSTFRRITTVGIAGLLGAGLVAASGTVSAHNGPKRSASHVLLLSVDGMHESDLAWFVQHHPQSALASLVGTGSGFATAQRRVPSDWSPGLIAQVPGGTPSSTGVYSDAPFNHALLPAGTTPADCASAAPGVEVTYFEQLDKDPHALDAGQGLSG